MNNELVSALETTIAHDQPELSEELIADSVDEYLSRSTMMRAAWSSACTVIVSIATAKSVGDQIV